jgi:CopG family transcriptional regulator, nickel-responsive regulator
MQRITITIDDDLAAQFERLIRRQGYSNRSEAFRDLVRDRLATIDAEHPAGTHCFATLTYVYDHHERDLASRMTRASHADHDLAVATLHVHLDHDNCLETAVLQGPVDRVQAFADRVISQAGVRHGNLYVLPVRRSAQRHQHDSDAHPHCHVHSEPLV